MKLALVSLPKNEFRYPPIGLMRIANYVRNKNMDIEIKIIDNTFEDIFQEINNFKPDIIGLTTFTSYYQEAIDFAQFMKLKYPEVKIIIGGPHITTLPESLDNNFYCGILGEGEEPMLNILRSIKNNKKIDKILGVVYYKNGKLKINKKKPLSSNLDELHKMDYALINKKYFERKFIPEIYDFGISMGIMTSIGCPFNCRFCSIRACWETIRFRSLDSVMEEIKELYNKFRVRHIDFYDDLFSINKDRLNQFYIKLKEAGLLGKITFSCQARANMIDEEMCEILKKLGVKTVVFGFESGSDRILKYIKNDSSLSVETNKKAIILCKKYGLNVFGCLMTGMPYESLEDMNKTIKFIDFARKNKASRIWVQVLVPLPKTEIWEIAEKKGKVNKNKSNWSSIHIHNKEKPLLLEDNIRLEDFLTKYNLAKKKCRFFVYDSFFRTLRKNPLNMLYFLKEGVYYLKRLFHFLKQ